MRTAGISTLIDSWSARAWYFPTSHWAAQVSVGRIAKPEILEPGDQLRSTGSVHYTRGAWSSSLIWGRDHSTATRRNLNSYLAETVAGAGKSNWITARFELVDKDELDVEGVHRVGAYTIGYTRDIPSPLRHIRAGIGANASAYTTPGALKPYYGDHPIGANVYLRFRLRSPE